MHFNVINNVFDLQSDILTSFTMKEEEKYCVDYT